MTMVSIMNWITLEKNFSAELYLDGFKENWTHSIWLSAIYVALVFAGKQYMSNRDKFDLRMPLAVWSSILAVFSILGTLGTAPGLLDRLVNRSLRYSICDATFLVEGPSAFWLYAFTAAKAVELGDTAFIVLRKQPLVFLHWYHHITVMVYCFYMYGQRSPTGYYFTTINFVVHSVMYSYYSLKAFRVTIPHWVSMLITGLQLQQMVIGVFINSLVAFYQYQGYECNVDLANIICTFVLYASYFVLFLNFFTKRYIKSKPTQKLAVNRKQ